MIKVSDGDSDAKTQFPIQSDKKIPYIRTVTPRASLSLTYLWVNAFYEVSSFDDSANILKIMLPLSR